MDAIKKQKMDEQRKFLMNRGKVVETPTVEVPKVEEVMEVPVIEEVFIPVETPIVEEVETPIIVEEVPIVESDGFIATLKKKVGKGKKKKVVEETENEDGSVSQEEV